MLPLTMEVSKIICKVLILHIKKHVLYAIVECISQVSSILCDVIMNEITVVSGTLLATRYVIK